MIGLEFDTNILQLYYQIMGRIINVNRPVSPYIARVGVCFLTLRVDLIIY